MGRPRIDAPDAGVMTDEEAVAWLRSASVILFPTTATRNDRGDWTAPTPRSRAMLKARRKVERLRDLAIREGAPPLPLVAEARSYLEAEGLLELVETFANRTPV